MFSVSVSMVRQTPLMPLKTFSTHSLVIMKGSTLPDFAKGPSAQSLTTMKSIALSSSTKDLLIRTIKSGTLLVHEGPLNSIFLWTTDADVGRGRQGTVIFQIYFKIP
uniref:Uncharacterized protein n=1 Tax=Sphaerodactylus townsendi TaxID=933632 RepID=A0ACB8GE77_9SAUR